MYINQTHNLGMFGEDKTFLKWMAKIHKKRNIIKECFITYSYIWHINRSKSVYVLNAYSVKVWLRYVLPNTNNVYFCVFFQIWDSVASCQKTVLKIKKSVQINNFNQYVVLLIFSTFFSPLHRLVKIIYRRNYRSLQRFTFKINTQLQ